MIRGQSVNRKSVARSSPFQEFRDARGQRQLSQTQPQVRKSRLRHSKQLGRPPIGSCKGASTWESGRVPQDAYDNLEGKGTGPLDVA